MEKDKKVFLLDRQHYRREMVENLTEQDLEDLVGENYDDNDNIIKVDANTYATPEEAIDVELDYGYDEDDYYIFSFGF